MSTNDIIDIKQQEEYNTSMDVVSILDKMKNHLEDVHVQYCSLLELSELLIEDSQPTRQEEIVLAFIECQVVSELFQPILHVHQERQQVQFQLTRVLTKACKVQVHLNKGYKNKTSGRIFQLECGRFFIWKDIEKMRAQHPQEITLQTNSLMALEAIIYQNEFHTIQLVQEENMMIWTQILEFIQQAYDHELIVASVHLLQAFSSFPRIVEELISTNILVSTCQSLICVLVHQSLNDLSLAKRCVETIHLLVHKKSPVSNLFSLHASSSSPICIHTLFGGAILQRNGGEETLIGEGGEWLVLLLDRWQAFPSLLYELIALVTDIFAIPKGYEQIAHTLVNENRFVWKTLDMMSRILLSTPRGTNITGKEDRESFQNHILYLECLRALRQLMSIQNVLVDAFGDVHVKNTLIPRLLQLLDLQYQASSSDQQVSSSTSFYPQDLQIQFEWLLLLQCIGQAKDLYQQTFIQNGLYSKIRTYLQPSMLQNQNQKLLHLVEREYKKSILLFQEKQYTPINSSTNVINTTSSTAELKSRHRARGREGEKGKTTATTTNMGTRHYYTRQSTASSSSSFCSSPSTKVRHLQPLVIGKQVTTPINTDSTLTPVPTAITSSQSSTRSAMRRGSGGISSSSTISRSMSLLPLKQKQDTMSGNNIISDHYQARITRGSRRRPFRLNQS
jgi:hypothetical protein